MSTASNSNCLVIRLSLILLLLNSATTYAENELNLTVHSEEFSIKRYASKGEQLILFIASGYGFNERSLDFASALNDLGIEVWMLDLSENLFLPRGNNSIRQFDGRYVAKVIELAHQHSGKSITLLSSSFGAIPTLRGARLWQLNNAELTESYVTGAILFSPELYQSIPDLGEDPELAAIASASNIPVMIYQSELRNNRWHLENLITKLEQNNAVVYRKILPQLTAFFYQADTLPATLRALKQVPREIPGVIKLLAATPTPRTALPLHKPKSASNKGLDTRLKIYKGKKSPLALDLFNLQGQRIVRSNYKGRITIVNFWATWCPPCVEEIPMLNRLNAAIKDSRFELLSINFGQDKQTIQDFLKQVNVEFPVLLDPRGKTAGQWNTVALPSTFVIGPDGEFAYAVNAAIEWDSAEVISAMKALLP